MLPWLSLSSASITLLDPGAFSKEFFCGYQMAQKPVLHKHLDVSELFTVSDKKTPKKPNINNRYESECRLANISYWPIIYYQCVTWHYETSFQASSFSDKTGFGLSLFPYATQEVPKWTQQAHVDIGSKAKVAREGGRIAGKASGHTQVYKPGCLGLLDYRFTWAMQARGNWGWENHLLLKKKPGALRSNIFNQPEEAFGMCSSGTQREGNVNLQIEKPIWEIFVLLLLLVAF